MPDLKKTKAIVEDNAIKPSAVKNVEQTAVLKKVQDGLDQSIQTTVELMALAKRMQKELAVIPQRVTSDQKNKLASPDVQKETYEALKAKVISELNTLFDKNNKLLSSQKQTLTQVKGEVSDISADEAPKSPRRSGR